ncbi:energy-coupling factor transporter transmembrane component T family protein [Thermanaeromonas sp. C210]|uniref:energy-coupling factor transporter transmembrane component T family protein n=1 Tax=Thermanaeromonas sp. C210 TaxID=2731925 RepID=UPI00155C27A3|nr:energy-coupling factor transporter transmembrane component T [Thermanaeromonas sp. C210]GFN22378.1 cobalt ABC transporter permease [Thermanaeromonas sp. C210]
MNLYLYLDKDTIIHRLDPRAKIMILICSFAIPLLNDHPLWSLGAAALILLYGFLAQSLSNIKRIKTILILIFIFSSLVWFVFARGSTPLFWRLTRESVMYGIATGIKIDAMIIAGLIFLSTTKNEEITVGLIRLGLPFPVAFAFSTALRLVPTFVGAGATVSQAQRSRGLDLDSGSFLEKIQKYVPLLVPIFLSSIRNSDGLAMALESKGFGAYPHRTFYLQLQWKKVDTLFLAVFLLLTVLNAWAKIQGLTGIPGLIK